MTNQVGARKQRMRTIMQWNSDANSGFTDNSTNPWVAVNSGYQDNNVDVSIDSGRILSNWLFNRYIHIKDFVVELNAKQKKRILTNML